MKILERLTANHFELTIHPRLGSFMAELCLFSLAVHIKFRFKALKKALQTKWIGFNYFSNDEIIFISILGIDILFGIYKN